MDGRGAPSPFAPFLGAQGFVLLDGGLATELEARGVDLGDPLWSARALLDAPDALSAVHTAYLRAGADCVATATYQATFEGLRARGLDQAGVERVFRRAVELAVEARDAFWADPANRPGRLRPLVAASVGPYGAYLANGAEYTGEYGLDEDALAAWHRPRWRLLAETPADLLACETLPSLPEVRALLRLVGETPGRWAWLSFQCRDAAHLADGSPAREAASLCAGAPGVAAVGVNCVPPDLVGPLLGELRRGFDGPLAAYPNSGETWDARARAWSGERSPCPHPDLAPGWAALGATVLGGCCRTGPATIAAVRRALGHARGVGPARVSPA